MQSAKGQNVDADENQGYEYRPIASSSRDIRLLTILPGQLDEAIHCTLHTVSLENRPPYETLSYAWGDSKDSKPIHVDGTKVYIRKNLHSALTHLRLISQPLVIWADALCINQEDLLEKSHQVRLMGEIYRNCSRVHIWLDCDSDCCNSTSARQHATDNFDVFQWARKVVNMNDSQHLNVVSARGLEGLSKVIQSPWWTRLWTVQETVLPERALVNYSQWQIPFEELSRASLNDVHHIANCCYGAFNDRLWAAHMHQFSELVVVIADLVIVSDQIRKRLRPDLLDLTLRFSTRSCQDPRDKVYGLMALLGPTPGGDLVPDYTLELPECFKLVTESYIKAETSLKCLAGNMFGPKSRDMPSWVRDLHKPASPLSKRKELERHNLYDFYSASADTVLSATFPKPGHLRLFGRLVGSVSALSIPDDGYSPVSVGAILGQWLQMALKHGVGTSIAKDKEAVQRAFCRTIFGGVVALEAAPTGFTRIQTLDFNVPELQLLDAFVHGRIEFKDIPSVIHSNMRFDGRAFFISSAGNYGLCIPGVKIGDEIWVVHGGRTPFVMRKCNKDNPDDPHRYFLGDCYLDEHMFGEAINGVDYVPEEVILI